MVARKEGAIIGYATFVVDTGVCLLRSILVAEAFRNQGVASQLLEEVEKAARQLGAHKAWLETGSTWDARRLYEKHGYQVRTELPDHYGHCLFVLMDKPL